MKLQALNQALEQFLQESKKITYDVAIGQNPDDNDFIQTQLNYSLDGALRSTGIISSRSGMLTGGSYAQAKSYIKKTIKQKQQELKSKQDAALAELEELTKEIQKRLKGDS